MPQKLGLLLAILIVASTGGCSDNDGGVFNPTHQVVGSGIVITETRPVSGFNAVTFASEGRLDIVMGATEALSKPAASNRFPANGRVIKEQP